MNEIKDFLTPREAAERMGASKNMVYQYFDRGELKGYRMPGNQRRIPLKHLLAFMEAHGIPDFETNSKHRGTEGTETL